MITAVTGKPPQGLDQFRSQFYTAGIDLEPALEDFAPATDNIKKTTCRLGIEDGTAIVFNFFKTTAPALQATAIPVRIFDDTVGHHLLFAPLRSGSHHIPQGSHPLGSIIRLAPKLRQGGLFFCGSPGRTGQSEGDSTIAAINVLYLDFNLFPFLDNLARVVDPLA